MMVWIYKPLYTLAFIGGVAIKHTPARLREMKRTANGTISGGDAPVHKSAVPLKTIGKKFVYHPISSSYAPDTTKVFMYKKEEISFFTRSIQGKNPSAST
ncbi:hypothetical protein EVAR_102333_1 [Eumeta japonica]|uniref:Uncharacterized protein n=1 Tax=Eumeta variegata TaxID=151549 RepID=A0A4C1ZH49_EUMVA|nr:hypothetical protein EVAR_102333_1 [Eumeta japonica]